MVHSLILAYGLLGKMNLIQPKEATVDELALFHSTYYLNYLSNNCRDADNSDDDYDSGDDVDEEQLNYGLGTHGSYISSDEYHKQYRRILYSIFLF